MQVKKVCLGSILALALLLQFGLIQTVFAAKVKVGTALRTQAVFAMPMLAVEENDLWKKVGVDAEWVPFKGGSAMHRAATAGSVHVGITDITGTVRVIGKGLPFIVVYHMGPVTDFGIWVLTKSALKKPSDLAGKTVAISRMGGTSHAYAQLVAKAEGLEGSMKIVAAGGSRSQVASLLSKAVDSIHVTPFVVGPLAGQGRARLLVSDSKYLPKRWMGRILYATTGFLKQDPDSVGKVTKAVNMATKFVVENRDWTIGKMKSFSKYTPEAAEFLYPRLKYSKDGKIDKQAVVNVRDFLIKFNLIKADKTPPAEKMYTDRFTR
jgi:ABC-type nitrate/sulfonate/bicarbonate transport system substrate-binding protein